MNEEALIELDALMPVIQQLFQLLDQYNHLKQTLNDNGK